MPVELFSNLATTTISSGGTTAPSSGTVETLTAASPSGFPSANSGASPPTQFHIADTASGKGTEIIAVTLTSGGTWTATRGAENTTPVAHSAGWTAQIVLTAGGLSGMLQGANNLSDVASQQAALNTVAGGVTSGRYLRGNGTNVVLSAIQAGDVPTLNQSTTGNAATATAAAGLESATTTVAVSGATAPTSGQVLTAASSTVATWQTPSSGFTNPMTTVGDTIYEGTGPAAARLAGNTSATKNFLTQTGTGTVSAAPAWGTIGASDLLGAWPWQFSVTAPAYGALGNGKVVTDAAITASGTALACTTSTPFTSGDVGKYVIVNGAGAVSGESLVTTISAFTDSGHVTLAAAAGQTVSGATACFGTDDTAAFQSAVNAAVTYAQAHALYAEVIVPPAAAMFYMIAGALQTGGSTHGNAQITLPVISTSAGKVTLVIRGTQDTAALAHWQQQAPLLAGSSIVSTGVFGGATPQSNSINASGNPCIIGGPAQPAGYGTTGALFSNMCIKLDGLRLIVPMSQNGYAYCGADFSGVAAAAIGVLGIDSTATYFSEWQSHNMGAAGFNFGILMPAGGNNDRCPITDLTVGGGFVYGVMLTEHCAVDRLRILYCWTALGISGSYWSAANVHAIWIGQASIEQPANILKIFGAGAGGTGPYLDIEQLDVEVASTLNLLDDGSSGLADARGTIKVTGFVPTGVNVNGSAQSASNNTGLKILFSSNAPGPAASPPAPPSSGSPWFNPYWRDAWITVSATTITALSIDSTAQKGLAASPAAYSFLLPSGHAYTPTYTGTLTHTVTLI